MLVKIGSVVVEMFSQIGRFLPYRFKSTNFSHLNLWRYWTNVHHICTQCRGINCAIHLLIHIAIFNSVLKCQGAEWRSLCKFCPKSVAMATSVKESKKRSVSRKFTQTPFIWWKDRENRSSRYWDNLSQVTKKKKLMQAKYIDQSAGLLFFYRLTQDQHFAHGTGRR